MEEWAETGVSSSEVWKAWQRAIEKGGKRVVQICPGQSFTLSWRGYFSKVLCTHMVKEGPKGALIGCRMEIQGIFAPFIRWMLKAKIKKNLQFVVSSMAKSLSY